jgi:hypothetical protein
MVCFSVATFRRSVGFSTLFRELQELAIKTEPLADRGSLLLRCIAEFVVATVFVV